MKRVLFIIIGVFIITLKVSAQKSDTFHRKRPIDFQFDACYFYTPLLAHNFFGQELDVKFYLLKRLQSGIYISHAEKSISGEFGYPIRQPVVYYYEIGWVNQYNFLQSKWIRAGISVVNGIDISTLGDNAHKVLAPRSIPRSVATNDYYLLEPGLDIYIKLFSPSHGPDLWLTMKGKYRYVFGYSKYASTKDFSNYITGLGFSLTGFNKRGK